MTYKHDVFLSYRRGNAWPKFVRDRFLPIFTHWLAAELGRDPAIYVDVERIETGMQWPNELANGVATSRVMLCLWSKEYFASDWCMAELAHMMARRVASDAVNPPPLVLAAVIHDGEQIPAELGAIQQFGIQKYSSPWIRPGSSREEELSDLLTNLAGHVARALERAPAFDPNWPALATAEFVDLFRRKAGQALPPSLGGAAR